MEQRKDYYKILGITEEEKQLQGDEFLKCIKPKYRKISLETHPDRNPGDKVAEAKFKDAAEAYSVLSDPQKRAEYDNPMSQFQFNGAMDMEEIVRHFRSHFNDDLWFGVNKGMKGQDIMGSVSITLEDVLNGVEKKVRYTRKKVCHTCNGTGNDSSTREEVCPHCHGMGYISHGFGNMVMRSTCPYCRGTGKIVINPCKSCGGSGLEDDVVEQSFFVPQGAIDGMTFRMDGLGSEVPGEGNIPGDLLVTVRIAQHPVFTRNNNDLFMNVNISVIDAILGTKVRITTLQGTKLDVNVPRGSEEGRRLVINGYGLPEYGTGRKGNLICLVHIVMPKKLSEKDVKELEKLKKSDNFQVR